MTARGNLRNIICAQASSPEDTEGKIDAVVAEATVSTRAALSDRAPDNRELRREAGRTADLIEAGETAQGMSLLRSLARSITAGE
ncbi:hypothetical protein [Streptomyces sp. NPDC058011]|uniref:hypothetical protein n=1 Tax=Streptomyces sp. NPDC058011 TaxID=3346305 RepID=UPI0036E684BC